MAEAAALLEAGPGVESLEVDRDALILGVRVTGPAEGARPAAELVYQVFTVVDGQIVEIRGYPDRARALGRG